MNFTTENTTHAEAVRLLNDRDIKQIDLYHSLAATQKQNAHVISLLFDIWNECRCGQVAQNLPVNPLSIAAIKNIDKFFGVSKGQNHGRDLLALKKIEGKLSPPR